MRIDLDEWIGAYIEGAGLTEAPPASPLFRAGERRNSPLTERPLSPRAVEDMLKRRLAEAELPRILSHHPDLRPETKTRHPQPRRAHLRLTGGFDARRQRIRRSCHANSNGSSQPLAGDL